MRFVEEHGHRFEKWEWRFSDPENRAAFSTTRVVRENYPVLLVSHDENGDWQFLCDTTTDTKHLLVVCLACAFQRDRTIGELADLPTGWMATREYVGAPWYREKSPPENDQG